MAQVYVIEGQKLIRWSEDVYRHIGLVESAKGSSNCRGAQSKFAPTEIEINLLVN